MCISDILPRLKTRASHAHQTGGSLGPSGFEFDELMAVPRRRYSYPTRDSEVRGCVSSVCVPEGLLFDEANTESTASFRGVETRRFSVVATDRYMPVGHLILPIRAFERMKTAIHPRRLRRGILACESYNLCMRLISPVGIRVSGRYIRHRSQLIRQ